VSESIALFTDCGFGACEAIDSFELDLEVMVVLTSFDCLKKLSTSNLQERTFSKCFSNRFLGFRYVNSGSEELGVVETFSLAFKVLV